MTRGRRSGARGQILAIVAGGLVGLLAVLALALEGGTLIVNRREGQNAADLASVAAARIVAQRHTNPDDRPSRADVFNAIAGTMTQNDCGGEGSAPCEWTARFVGAGLSPGARVTSSGNIPGSALGVVVSVTRRPGAILGRVLGLREWRVSTEATAVAAKPTTIPADTLLPIAICGWGRSGDHDCLRASSSTAIDFEAGQIYDLTDGKDAPGGFGWLSWGGGSVEASVCTPNNPQFTLGSGTWFPVGAGSLDSPGIQGCLGSLISSGKTVLVAIYDQMRTEPDVAYHITGVAAFVITAQREPSVDQIQGYFVDYYPLPAVPSGGSWLVPTEGDQTTFIGLVR